MINAEFLHRLFPRADEIPLEHSPPAAIHQRPALQAVLMAIEMRDAIEALTDSDERVERPNVHGLQHPPT